MEYIKTRIEGVIIIKPRIFRDARGYFMETFSLREFQEHVGDIQFVQDNQSSSVRGVVRGLHFQRIPYAQSKLVRCVSGRVLDVAVDVRQDSPTFGQHVAVELDADSGTQLFLPRGMAHGFAVLSDRAVFEYKCDSYYHPEAEGGFHPFDNALGIDWRIPASEAILSDKDKARLSLADSIEQLNFTGNLYD